MSLGGYSIVMAAEGSRVICPSVHMSITTIGVIKTPSHPSYWCVWISVCSDQHPHHIIMGAIGQAPRLHVQRVNCSCSEGKLAIQISGSCMNIKLSSAPIYFLFTTGLEIGK